MAEFTPSSSKDLLSEILRVFAEMAKGTLAAVYNE
jgi:hypothetical protein